MKIMLNKVYNIQHVKGSAADKVYFLEELEDRFIGKMHVIVFGQNHVDVYMNKNTTTIFSQNYNIYMGSLLIEKEEVKKSCDCGSFKTYGSLSPEFHSSWCDLRRS